MKFIESQMFSQVHSIGYLVEFFQETMNKFALQHVFDFQPMNLFSECPIPAQKVYLQIIVRGCFMDEEKMQQLKPFILDKELVFRIFNQLKTFGHPKYLAIGEGSQKNWILILRKKKRCHVFLYVITLL